MRIILFLMMALFMSANFTSCTPTSIAEQAPVATEQCCGEDGDLDPPPPPPPPTGEKQVKLLNN